jgi:hypothetical protein
MPSTQAHALTDSLLARLDETEHRARDELHQMAREFPAVEFEVDYQWARLTRPLEGVSTSTTLVPGAPSPARVVATCRAQRCILAENRDALDRAGDERGTAGLLPGQSTGPGIRDRASGVGVLQSPRLPGGMASPGPWVSSHDGRWRLPGYEGRDARRRRRPQSDGGWARMAPAGRAAGRGTGRRGAGQGSGAGALQSLLVAGRVGDRVDGGSPR